MIDIYGLLAFAHDGIDHCHIALVMLVAWIATHGLLNSPLLPQLKNLLYGHCNKYFVSTTAKLQRISQTSHVPKKKIVQIKATIRLIFSFAVEGRIAISRGMPGGLMQATRAKPASRRFCSSAIRPAMSITGTSCF